MSNALEDQKLDIANAKKIWETLSKIDVGSMIEKKGKLSYLSWASAWEVVMQNYPLANFTFLPTEVHEDQSVTVHVSVTIHGFTRAMWLPVMDHRNNSIANPSSRQVSDAKMRCLVKCLAMFGLGLYIYRGEDVPSSDDKPAESPGKAQAPSTTPSSSKPSAPSKANSLDDKLVSSKQLAAIVRGAGIIADTDNAEDPAVAMILTNVKRYVNDRRKEEDRSAIDLLQEMSYFDAERAIKFLTPKVKKAKADRAGATV